MTSPILSQKKASKMAGVEGWIVNTVLASGLAFLEYDNDHN